MPGHPETQAAFHAALAGQTLPGGITAVGDLAKRFSVYRNTVTHSLISALALRFPAVRRIVGPAFFDAMAAVFVRVHPPRTPLIHAYGSEFPGFVAQFPPASTLPYLPDVARIEVLRGQAYHAADAEAITAKTLSDILGAKPDAALLLLHPSIHVATSDHPAVSIWQMNQPGATPTAPPPGAEAALIFRRNSDVVVLPVDLDAALIAARLAQGASLGIAALDHGPERVAGLLTLLLRHELITGAFHPERSSI